MIKKEINIHFIDVTVNG